MTFLQYLGKHGVKFLGAAQGTVALLSSQTGLIPAEHLKYWVAASGVLTFWLGLLVANQQETEK